MFNYLNYKLLPISKVFTVTGGKPLNASDVIELDSSESINYITRTANNNGVKAIGIVEKTNAIEDGNAITIGDTTATVFYQEKPFVVGPHILILRSPILNKYVAQFLITQLNINREKYPIYARSFNKPLIESTLVYFPVKDNSKDEKDINIDDIDVKEIENYIHSFNITKENVTQNIPDYFLNEGYNKACWYMDNVDSTKFEKEYAGIKKINEITLKTGEWKKFKLFELFTRIEPTKGDNSTKLIDGDEIPYVAASQKNCGVSRWVQATGFENWISKGNCIVFVHIGDGAAGWANYIDQDFIGMTGKTSCGYIDNVMNPYIGLFLATVLSTNKEYYSHGRGWNGKSFKNTILELPVKKDSDGKIFYDSEKKYSSYGYVPDWKFMEDYIKSLSYSCKIENSK